MSDKYPTAGLKPCPFCGQDVHPDYDAPRYVIHQTNKKGCSHGRIFMDRYGWNTRPIEDALRARIAELEAERRWIPVSERLPDNWESVLTIDISKSTRGPVTAFYNPETSLWATHFSCDLWVTHWMPLPEPPIVYGKVCPEVQE